MQSLPIDSLLPDVTKALETRGALVLEAAPGAGKTTRVPWHLAQTRRYTGEVVVTEPRRLAARMAATRVAEERGLTLGEEVGYSVRFEDRTSRKTRVRYCTEGLLLRRLSQDPTLRGVSAVVLDEFHERSLDVDLLLMLLRRLRASGSGPELLVMSATLDGAPVASYLDDAPRLTSEGRLFPVDTQYHARPDERPLEKQVASAVREATARDTGNVLVFLPGAAEIRRCSEALARLADERGLDVLPLHGELAIAEQARAIAPGQRRKVVLSTNVAESSVTVHDVGVVVDSGLARVMSCSPWSGMPSLELEKVSRASLRQRAGRSGRTKAGHVFRLFTKGDAEARSEQAAPELVRADLASAALLLASLGIEANRPEDWLTFPGDARWTAAFELMRALGALDQERRPTALGRRMMELPVHPRLARIVLEGETQGVTDQATLIAALAGERSIERRATFGERRDTRDVASGDSDLLAVVERYLEAADAEFRRDLVTRMGLDAGVLSRVRKAHEQLRRLVHDQAPTPTTPGAAQEALLLCILSGFVDRLALRRRAGQSELVLAGGQVARLSPSSVVHTPMLMVAIDAEQRPGRGVEVRVASAVRENWLYEHYAERLRMSEEQLWNPSKERVETLAAMRWGAIVLEESRDAARPGQRTSELLLHKALERPERFLRNSQAQALSGRLSLARAHGHALPDPDELLKQALTDAAEVGTSFEDLEQVPLASRAWQLLDRSSQRLLEQQVPEQVRLASGRQATVNYEPDKPPWLASRLQDFFGERQGPQLLFGTVPVLLHLLAPNQRAVQVTTDLAGFWQRHYPGIRKELMRRYPRHLWPEDGASASPPPPRNPRRR